MRIQILIIVLLLSGNVSATHNIGGIITYRHLTGNSYEATITTYTNENSPADSPMLELFWGDATSDTLSRISSTPIGNDVVMNIYMGNHAYASEGNYTLYIENPNRNSGIMNIPNSINAPLHIETELRINAKNINNSAVFSGVPFFNLAANDSFSFNFGFYDRDADIITYELITPKGLNGDDIAGYTMPSGVSLNPVSGQLNWNTPQQIGTFVYAIKVTECRNNETVGSVVFDMMYTVSNLPGNAVIFQNLSALNMDNNGNYSYVLQPNQNFQLQVKVDNASALIAFGEPLLSPNTATFTEVSSATDKLFAWQPTTARCTPYSIVFRGESEQSKDVAVLIHVREQNMEYCDTLCGAALSVETLEEYNPITIYPNPASTQLTIAMNSLPIAIGNRTSNIDQIAIGCSIMNTIGQEVLLPIAIGTTLNIRKSTFDISSLAPGLYLLQVFDETSELLKTEKIVKQ
jgi:hypothetical protein